MVGANLRYDATRFRPLVCTRSALLAPMSQTVPRYCQSYRPTRLLRPARTDARFLLPGRGVCGHGHVQHGHGAVRCAGCVRERVQRSWNVPRGWGWVQVRCDTLRDRLLVREPRAEQQHVHHRARPDQLVVLHRRCLGPSENCENMWTLCVCA